MLDGLYRPRSVAVIGASRNPLSIGYRVLINLRDNEFNGPIFPVNPKEKSIAGFRSYASILDIPDDVDLVNISIPARFVPQAIEDCGRKGVKFAIVHSGGFREAGPEGENLEKQAVLAAHKYGMRIYGPNSQGVMNSDPAVSLYANFTFTPMKEGAISILAQSGGVGELFNIHLSEAGVGFRLYGSNGNASDISITELLSYFGQDEKTRGILLYVESLPDPAEFVRVASKITPKKPIFTVKPGRSMEGAKAITSHTGALMNQDTMSDVLFERAGIIRFYRQQDAVQAAVAFSRQGIPKGNRITIVTNAGGPAIQATDEAVAQGLELSVISRQTKEKLAQKASPMSSLGNPVDLTATAGPEEFGHTVKTLLADPDVDMLLLSLVTPFFVDNEGIIRNIVEAVKEAKTPTVAAYSTNQNWGHVLDMAREGGLPVYEYSESAAAALAAVSRYAQIRSKNRGELERFGCDEAKADGILQRAVAGQFMPFVDAFELLRCYGVSCIECTKSTAVEIDKKALAYPVVLKADAREIVHKTEAGAVELNIEDSVALFAKARAMEEKFPGANLVIQPYVKSEREIIIGVKRVGTVAAIMVGLGGILAEILQDVAFRLVPITRVDARAMLESLHGYPVLAGARGEKSVDFKGIEDILLKISQLTHRHPSIEEIDVNPVAVFPEEGKSVALDVRIKVGGNHVGKLD